MSNEVYEELTAIIKKEQYEYLHIMAVDENSTVEEYITKMVFKKIASRG